MLSFCRPHPLKSGISCGAHGLNAIRNQIVVDPIAHLDWCDAFKRLGSIGEVWPRLHRLHDTTCCYIRNTGPDCTSGILATAHPRKLGSCVASRFKLCNIVGARDFNRPGSE